MPAPTTRVTIDVNGQPKSLFLAREKRSGGVTLSLRTISGHPSESAALYRSGAGRTLTDEHISIHPTRHSGELKNVIHRTSSFNDGTKINYYYETSILKDTNTFFSSVFIRRSSALTVSKFNATPNRHFKVSLGSYNPARYSLIYGVFIGKRGSEFIAKGPKTINVSIIDLTNLRLIVLWTYLSTPAHASFDTRYVNNVNSSNKFLFAGMSAQDCILDFMRTASHLSERLFDLYMPTDYSSSDIVFYKKIAGFFKSGDDPDDDMPVPVAGSAPFDVWSSPFIVP